MDTIYKKIEKLLSLAQSDNENEAKLAAQRANELLVRHNLKITDLKTTDYTTEDIETVQRKSTETTFIDPLLGQYFFVKMIHTKERVDRKIFSTVRMIGTPENIAIAMYVRSFLIRSFKECWKSYKKETGATIKSRQAFFMGLYQGLGHQLKDTKTKVEQETGLVVV